MSAQVYSAPVQTEETRKAFLEWRCGDNIGFYKKVHYPITTRENKEHHGNFEINQ